MKAMASVLISFKREPRNHASGLTEDESGVTPGEALQRTWISKGCHFWRSVRASERGSSGMSKK